MRFPDPRWTTVLLDADGTLFPSEEPAFAASADVVNQLLAETGAATVYDGEELRRTSSGRNFRGLVPDLLAPTGHGLTDAELDHWVAREADVVTAHLRTTLRPDARVSDGLARLGSVLDLALVSSTALSRLATCLEVTGLAPLLPPERRFSAQDSLPTPTSKPDPAVYQLALARLGIAAADAVAVEDAVSGVRSAAAAGITVVGITAFVPEAERASRRHDLFEAGAATVVSGWEELADLLVTTGTTERRPA
jgi:beta-phosphoglucomutase-like phosphatase (HAD superfamily)